MLAIYKRELKSYFTSVIACLFIAVTALIEGGFFVAYNLNNGLPYIIYPISTTLLILVFTIPILTMKVLADERKQKTDQLILTSPVSIGKIVVGKYLALCTIYLIPILITCMYPLILRLFGSVPMKMSYTGILGMLLYGVALIAIGMFISSITESQVISAIVSIVVMFIGYMMATVTQTISSEGNIITKIFNCFDILSPVNNMLNGVISISVVIYYISLVVIFLFLTTQSMQKRKWNVSKNTISTSVFSSTFIIIAIAITVIVNMIAVKVEENVTWTSIDMTDQKMYAITDDTKKMLSAIDDKIVIYVLGSEKTADSTLNETLKRYGTSSKNIKVVYKDTTRYPNFYSNYTDNAPTANSLIVVDETKNKSKVIDYQDIYISSYDYSTYTQTTTGYDAEGKITSAVSYVMSDRNAVIFSVTGHNESGMGEEFKSAVEKLNIDLKEVNLLNYEEIKEDDCQALLLLSPQSDYSKEDADKVLKYLKNGGNAIITTAYTTDDMPNFNSIVEYYSINILNGMVAENDTSHYYQNPFAILASEGKGYASELSNYAYFPYAQGVYIDTKGKNHRDTITYTDMLTTTEKSVCKMNPDNATKYEKESGDKSGPFNLALSLTETISKDDGSEVTTNLSVIASYAAFTDETNSLVSGSNLELFTNIISDYVQTDDNAVSIPAKAVNYSNLTVTGSGYRMVGILVAIIVPLGILASGIVIWIRRGRRQ